MRKALAKSTREGVRTPRGVKSPRSPLIFFCIRHFSDLKREISSICTKRLKNFVQFAVGRWPQPGPKIPLYHILPILSIGNLHKDLRLDFPKIVQLAVSRFKVVKRYYGKALSLYRSTQRKHSLYGEKSVDSTAGITSPAHIRSVERLVLTFFKIYVIIYM